MKASGSGGFYKYRCRYFFSHNCSNWVYVSNSACAACLGKGRDEDKAPAQPQGPSWNAPAPLKEIYVPFFLDGVLQYSLMQVVPTDSSGLYWELKHKVAHPGIPVVPTTSDQPRAVFAPTAGPTSMQS